MSEPEPTEADKPEPRSLLRLEEKAIREGWSVPNPVRVRILNRLTKLIDPETVFSKREPKPTLSHVLSATKIVVAADLTQQRIELARERLELLKSQDPTSGPLIDRDRIAEAEQLAQQRLSERVASPANETPGPVL